MSSKLNFGEHGRCEALARSAGRRCKRPAVGPHGKCDKHGGASAGPRDSSQLEGNQHAVGNSGGCPPERNSNARVHGVFSSLDAMDDRIKAGEGDMGVIHHLALLEYDILKTSRRNAPDMDEDRRRELAHEYALLSQKETRANLDFFERGFAWPEEETFETEDGPVTVERHHMNPTFRVSSRLSRRMREIRDELKAWPKYD